LIPVRTILTLFLGATSLAAYFYSRVKGSFLGIAAVDISHYPYFRVHPLVQLFGYSGVALLALGLGFLIFDVRNGRRRLRNE
jgi:hypothetical protein